MQKYLFIILVIISLSLAACSPAPAGELVPPDEAVEPTLPPTEPPIPTITPYAGGGRIVFSSTRDDPGILGLYIMDLDTQEISQVNTGFEVSLFGRWSPDGNVILLSEGDIWNLYTIYPDGSHLTQITDFRSANADWSPDGSRIVFQSDHQNEPEDTPDIYLIDSTGENMIEILDDPETPDYYPRWSPDGKKILFVSTRTGKTELFTISIDGTEIVQITETEEHVAGGEWSPDGSRIVFVYGGSNLTDLYVVDADGESNLVRLTSNEHHNQSPSWSPDGSQIVFSSDMGENWDWNLWVINADGSGLVQLTDDLFYDGHPDWSP